MKVDEDWGCQTSKRMQKHHKNIKVIHTTRTIFQHCEAIS